MKHTAILLTGLFLICACGIASAQQTDISANVLGVYTREASGSGLHETATKSLGMLLSFRHFPQQHNGLEVNYAYTKNSQRYTDVSGAELKRVQAGIHELTGAYVYHITRGALQPFALAGAGFLIFNPTDSALKAAGATSISRKTEPAFLYGAGTDIRVTHQLALRAQCRGLISKAPDFYGAALALHTGAAKQILEPSVGVIYRF